MFKNSSWKHNCEENNVIFVLDLKGDMQRFFTKLMKSSF